ncbi:cellulose binding domain-containing protein [Microbispora sp. NBC_01189]|uniref:pectate lyase family protein n=1 Tax=Microbispora sp. NBC_01189 TaxID=2903583 RepID=UPI002E0E017C|nr:cellulose binding domain-containing protein [Microbispora sp. NBC_01189]
MSVRRHHAVLFGAVTAVAAAAAGLVGVTSSAANAASGCRVDYTVASQWEGGFVANIAITNLGDPLSNWNLGWSFGAGQTVSSGWGATFAQSGSGVTAANLSYNGSIGTGGSTSIGFQGTSGSSNPVPTAFTLNGVSCTGGVTGSPSGQPSPSRTPSPSPSPSPSQTPGGTATGLVGWATQNGGTTGGGNAGTVTVSSTSALTSAIQGTTASVVRVSGTISCSGMLKVGSNKTIVGASGATIVGCGLNVSQAKNVIIRNLVFRDWDDDAINVQYSTNVWIDHNTLSHGYDGAIDVKRASDFVTVSWNRLFNHDKTMLLGHSDDNGAEDRGHLRVTYHHNWFDGTTQRHPRVRFGNPVHVFNNYYNRNSGYGVASTEEAGVLVEGNYFENVKDPYHRGEGSSDPGNLVARNNYLVGSGSGDAGGSVASIPYSYSLDTPSSVKSVVTAGAGAR